MVLFIGLGLKYAYVPKSAYIADQTVQEDIVRWFDVINMHQIVPPAGIGPATPGLGILCSIH